MKRTLTHEMTLTVRSESGRCAVSIGLDDLTAPERKFLFDVVSRTNKGGSVGFGMEQNKPGEMALTLLLSDPIPVAAAVHHATH